MKRLLFVPGFSADTFHAIQKRYVALDRHLRGRLEFIWCLPPDDPDQWRWQDPARRGETPGILRAVQESQGQIVRLPVHRGSFWRRVRDFRRVLTELRCDGLYAMFHKRFAPLYAGRTAGVTTIWDAAWNSLVPPGRQRFLKKFFYRRYIDYFAAATPFIADNLVSNGIGRERVFVRWNALELDKVPAVDAAEARRRIRAELGLPGNSDVILQVTSFLRCKNVPMAVRVLKLLLATRPNAYWLLVGEDGPDLPRVRALAERAGVTSRLIITGHRRDIWDLMAASDAVALTSCQEGLATCLIEAMAARRPVVTTRCNGPECVVADGQNGYVVELDDDATFAARLAQLLRDPALRSAIGDRGRSRVEREFDMPRWCASLGDFLCDCLERRPAGRAHEAAPGTARPRESLAHG
jgi:glycosyltransferase involved in cell wall biosynthesis